MVRELDELHLSVLSSKHRQLHLKNVQRHTSCCQPHRDFTIINISDHKVSVVLLQLASCVGTVNWSGSRSSNVQSNLPLSARGSGLFSRHGLEKVENRFRFCSISALLPLSWDKQVVKQSILCLLGGRASNIKSMEAKRKTFVNISSVSFRVLFHPSFNLQYMYWFLKGQKILLLKTVISSTDFNQAVLNHFTGESKNTLTGYIGGPSSNHYSLFSCLGLLFFFSFCSTVFGTFWKQLQGSDKVCNHTDELRSHGKKVGWLYEHENHLTIIMMMQMVQSTFFYFQLIFKQTTTLQPGNLDFPWSLVRINLKKDKVSGLKRCCLFKYKLEKEESCLECS